MPEALRADSGSPSAAATTPSAPATTVRAALAAAAARLDAAGCDTPRLDAEVLLAHVLGVDRARLVIDAPAAVPASAGESFSDLVARRAAREPVAYIVGRRDFRWVTLRVDPRVLIPRPETELLVETALELPAGARVLDVGTGSGAVALAVKHERPDLDVWGSDISAGAVQVAAANARELGLAVSFVVSDLRAGVPGGFDAVLANLPYVAADAVLAPDVARYEPAGALYTGEGGLALVRALVGQLEGVGFVALEVGEGQAGAVASLLGAAGYERVERRRDLAGIERVVVGRRSRTGVGRRYRTVEARRYRTVEARRSRTAVGRRSRTAVGRRYRTVEARRSRTARAGGAGGAGAPGR